MPVTHRSITLIVALFVLAGVAFADSEKPEFTKEQLMQMGASGSVIQVRGALRVPGVDISNLTLKQQDRVREFLFNLPCDCGCGMTLYQCRYEDPDCPVSPGVSQTIVDAIRANLSDDEVKNATPVERRYTEYTAHDFDLDGSPSKGESDAAITLVEFSDFQCVACASAHSWIPALLERYPGKLRFVFKQFPLDDHPHARLAAEASMAARDQLQFWDYHDRVFTNSQYISPLNLSLWADAIGLDLEAFNQSIKEKRHSKKIDADLFEGRRANIGGTPTFFINGKKLLGEATEKTLAIAIDDELRKLQTDVSEDK